MPFTALGLGPKLTKAIKEAGYTEPTPIQTNAIPAILRGVDLIGIAQTGTGKTAAFVLPLLQLMSTHGSRSGRRAMRALVIAPTRELVVQIEENVRRYAKHLVTKVAMIYGGVGEQPQIAALRNGAELVIATPGRLIDLMQQGHVRFDDLEYLVLDEADRMLDMGFLPQIRQIVRAVPKQRQTLLFSATLSKEIESLTAEFLTNPETVQIGKRSNPAETVAQFVYEVPKSRKLGLLVHLLKDQSLDSVLVFSRTKHGADKIARKLVSENIPTATLHSNRSQNQRLAALKGFRKGEVRVLVATDIAARGIDVEGISHVINFDFPPQPEDYVHRIGRTGRAKAIGDAISFVMPDDAGNLRSLERFIGRGIPRKVAEGFDYREVQIVSADENFDDRPRGFNRGRNQGGQHRGGAQQQRSQSQPQSHGRASNARPSNARPSSGAPRSASPGRPASSPSRPQQGRPSRPGQRPAGTSTSRPQGQGRSERRRTW